MVRRLSQIYLLLTAIAGVVLGMNCVLFCFCVYVLWGQNRKVLLFLSTMQLVLCIVQTALFKAYLIAGLIGHPHGAESYFGHIVVYSLPCYLVYQINYAIEELLMIWRIYVLYNYKIVWCIPSIILLGLQLGIGGVTAKGLATDSVITNPLRAFDLSTWVLMAAVNVSATVLICVRLWIARQRTHAILSQSTYKSSMLVVVECGALVTLSTIAMLILQAVVRPGVLAGVDLLTQIGTMVPLLVIARHGLLHRQGSDLLVASHVPLRVSVIQTEVTHVDAPVVSARKRRRLSESVPTYPDASHAKPFRDV